MLTYFPTFSLTRSLCTAMLRYFFFQAEDGIRDWSVTGVQTCALPIWFGEKWVRFVINIWPKAVKRLLRGNCKQDLGTGRTERNDILQKLTQLMFNLLEHRLRPTHPQMQRHQIIIKMWPLNSLQLRQPTKKNTIYLPTPTIPQMMYLFSF